MEGVVGVQNNAQFAFVRTSDVPSIQQGDTLVIGWATYTVVEVMPDGEGMTEILDWGPKYCGNRKVRMKWQI